MPEHVVERVTDALNEPEEARSTARGCCVLGVAYKQDIDDVRESPALDIIELLHRHGAAVAYVDPHVPSLRLGDGTMDAVPLAEAMKGGYDCAVIVTDHTGLDYDAVLKAFPLDRRHPQRPQGARVGQESSALQAGQPACAHRSYHAVTSAPRSWPSPEGQVRLTRTSTSVVCPFVGTRHSTGVASRRVS